MRKILSIDDSAQIRRIVRDAVAVLGFEFLDAVDGKEGLAVVEEHVDELDLVVLDVNMPGIDGFEVLKRLKESERFDHIPVMMLTTESEREAIVGAIRNGAVNYVTKPFGQEELITKMLESLSNGPEL